MAKQADSGWKRGDIVNDEHGPIRVMAVADRYAMVRRPGCTPFVRSLAQLDRLVHPKEATETDLTTRYLDLLDSITTAPEQKARIAALRHSKENP